ncbi:biotin/lipoyl-containing protein [Paracoccus marcusii]|nr:biotin/lipoyl-containing protein [Paracoccus marcusii]
MAKWLVKEGDEVKSGDVIAEIETDKATMEFEAVDEGRIGKILIAEGTSAVKVNTAIAVLLEDGEEAGDISAPKARKSPSPRRMPSPNRPKGLWRPDRRAGRRRCQGRRTRATVCSPRPWRGASPGQGSGPVADPGQRPRGRIVKADVENAKAGDAKPSASAAAQPRRRRPRGSRSPAQAPRACRPKPC